jgi:hypothetical protein
VTQRRNEGFWGPGRFFGDTVPVRLSSGSGPRIARLFHSLLALVLLDAWISLGSQVQLLIGSRGLLPLAPLVDTLQDRAAEIWIRFPSLFLLGVSDTALNVGIIAGCGLAVATLLGFLPRLALSTSAVLYLSYVVACRDFTSFQWDNLLIECLVLAVLLPRHRAAPFAHLLLRLLLFKLYFESGIAKAQSHLGDWFDGSAMSYYYETAPLPGWPGWYAHQLPETWHQIESWGAIGLEGLGAFLILGPRRARLAALIGFTGFQLINLATASYGFFVLLALALHVFLLDDGDLDAWSRLRRKLPSSNWWRLRLPSASLPDSLQRVATGIAVACGLLWMVASFAAGLTHFVASETLTNSVQPIISPLRPFRVANTYHLFSHITRDRIEPEFQVQSQDDERWRPLAMHYKPGPVSRPPRLATPHQPRVDFLLWFYGLSFRHQTPEYVPRLLDRLCHDPEAISPLFVEPLPPTPRAVRIEFWRYHYTTAEERRDTGAWWRRTSLGNAGPASCEE